MLTVKTFNRYLPSIRRIVERKQHMWTVQMYCSYHNIILLSNCENNILYRFIICDGEGSKNNFPAVFWILPYYVHFSKLYTLS